MLSRLIKLMAFAALGYVAYEFVQGFMQENQSGSAPQPSRSRDLHRALNEDRGRMNLTGQGRGTSVSTQDFQGGSTRHTVGRGVIHR